MARPPKSAKQRARDRRIGEAVLKARAQDPPVLWKLLEHRFGLSRSSLFRFARAARTAGEKCFRNTAPVDSPQGLEYAGGMGPVGEVTNAVLTPILGGPRRSSPAAIMPPAAPPPTSDRTATRPPSRDDAAVEDARRRTLEAEGASRSRRRNILTGVRGVESPVPVASKQLLGA